MRHIVNCHLVNASLGESIPTVKISRGVDGTQTDCIHKNAEENESRKNPEQTSLLRFFSGSSSLSFAYNHRQMKSDETYCQLTMAGSIPFHHINSTFSISHASTIVMDGPALCLFVTLDGLMSQSGNLFSSLFQKRPPSDGFHSTKRISSRGITYTSLPPKSLYRLKGFCTVSGDFGGFFEKMSVEASLA